MKLSSKGVALAGVFAALHAVLYLTSFELWRSWSIYLEPIEGVVLGPCVGFLAAFIGSVAGRAIKPTPLWMFGITAEPLGVLACGLIAKKQSKPLLLVYGFMLAAYFMHPLGRELPFWTILDILAAFVLAYPVTRLSRNLFEEDSKRLFMLMPLIAFIGAATDALARVFLLIPAGLYAVFGWTPEFVHTVFVAGAVDSYIEDVLVMTVSSIIAMPLLTALRKLPGIKYPLS
jgi:hypothetical protein